MMMKPAPRSASSGHIASSPRPPVTSLTIFAPASKAAAATSAFEVSIEINASPASSLITGMTRRFSSTGVDGFGPRTGRFAADIDDVGARRHHFSRLGERLWCLKKSLAVGKRVGVTFRTPMIQPVADKSKTSPAIFHFVTPHISETTTRGELFEAATVIYVS